MRFFDILDTQHLVLGIFFGLIAALLVYMGFGWPYSSTGKEDAGDIGSHPPKSRPIPTALLFLFIGFAVWLVCYVIFRGIEGGPL